MFYEGDLQSGVALAIRETKRVICFVRDDGDESETWEKEYLASEEISELIASKSIALRLTAGSQEAGFLSSFCPINKSPTLVVINNGVLQEYIVSGTNAEELKRRLTVALSGETGHSIPQQQEQQESQDPHSAAAQQTSIPPSAATTFDSPSHEPEPVREENAGEQLRRESIRAGKRRVESVDETPQPSEESKQKQKNWRQQQRNRKQQEKEERERVLARIRQDKEERKAMEEERKLAELPKDNTAYVSDQPRKPSKSAPSLFRIQVRVFDGSSIRSSFSPSQTVGSDVRSWIDAQRTDGDAPYTLKHILNPHPNRTIAVAEEDQTLDELGLGPTASLVMVPVQTYTEAYASVSSLPTRGISAGYNLVTNTVGTIAGALGTFLGIGQIPPSSSSQPAPQSNVPESSTPGNTLQGHSNPGPRMTNSNVRTLHDGRAERGTDQFYNGNQLNFEPRREQNKDE